MAPHSSTLQFSSVQFSHSVVSNSLRPQESQHTRPPCSSPSPGVHSGSRPSSPWCHPAISSSVVPFSSCPQSLPASESLGPHGLSATKLLCPWNFPGKHTGRGCHFLLQGISPTQGLNSGLLHCRQILYHLNHTKPSHPNIHPGGRQCACKDSPSRNWVCSEYDKVLTVMLPPDYWVY